MAPGDEFRRRDLTRVHLVTGRPARARYAAEYLAAQAPPDQGAALGIPTPVNAAIWRLVRAVERGERAPGPENLGELLAALP